MNKILIHAHQTGSWYILGKVRFEFGGEGGWAGASGGRVISKYFTNWGGSNLFYTQPGEGRSIFWQGKKLLHVV